MRICKDVSFEKIEYEYLGISKFFFVFIFFPLLIENYFDDLSHPFVSL